MTTRICLETATAARDEILPGDALSVTLRMKISEARAAGDEALVLELQDRYRRRPVPGRSWVSGGVTLSRTATGRPAAVTATATVLHTASSAESTVRSASRREIVGWLVTWGEGLASNDRGEVIYLDVQPADVRHWLSEVDPAEIPVKGDHLTAAVGRWHRFAMSNYGLMGVASIERSPAGDILLDAAAEGAGLSFAADISRCYKTHRFRNGLPVYAGGPIAILEGSVCPEPAGERCVINLVRGVQPAWLAAALDRHQQLSRS